VFLPGRPFQQSQIFAFKARANLRGTLELAPVLTRRHYSETLEKLARDKHSRLLQTVLNYGHITLVPDIVNCKGLSYLSYYHLPMLSYE
jgi:hypothetical protein